MDEVKLNTIQISGFKSIRESTVELHDINILIGPNGSGKSNLISSLYFLQNILEKNLQGYVAKVGRSSLVYGGLRTTKKIDMQFFFNDNSYGFELVPNDEGDLVFRREYYGWGQGKWNVSETANYESKFEKGVRNGIEPYVKPVLEAKKWRVYHFHDTTSTAGMKQEGQLSDTIFLHHDASNLAPFLYMLKESYNDSYEDIVRVVKMVAPYFGDFVLEPNPGSEDIVRLRWKQADMDDVFTVNQLSDGTIRFICLATLLLEPAKLQPSTIILDEPELGLHPYAISIFAELVHMVHYKNRKQFIISTQSTELLDNFEADDVIVAELTSNGSKYCRLSSDKLKVWLEDYSLSTVWKKNIFGGQP